MEQLLANIGIKYEFVVLEIPDKKAKDRVKKEKWHKIEKISLIYNRADDKKSSNCKLCPKIVLTTDSATTGLHNHAKQHKIFADKKPITSKKVEAKSALLGTSLQSVYKRVTPFESLAVENPYQVILARLVSKDGLSFSVIAKSDDMRKCLNARFCAENILHELSKSPMTIKKDVVTFATNAQKLVKQHFEENTRKGERYSLDFDEWSSLANRRYMNISVFGQSAEYWNLGLSRVIGHATAENLLGMVETKAKQFDLNLQNHVVCLITDGARVMERIKKISTIEHQLCLAHGIQAAVLDILYKKPTTSKEKFSIEAVETGERNAEISSDVGLEVKIPKKKEDLKNKIVQDTVVKVRKLGHSFKMSPWNTEVLDDYVRKEQDKYLDVEDCEDTDTNDDDDEPESDSNDDDSDDDAFSTQATTTNPATQATFSIATTGKKILKPLKVDCRTRWSSLLAMLERYWEIRDPVEHALISLKHTIRFTEIDQYIIWCVVKPLRPIACTVEDFCKHDSNLLTARSALILLFYKLEEMKEQNPVANSLLRQLKIRMKERLDKNCAILKYLSTGSLKNDYLQFSQNEGHLIPPDDDKVPVITEEEERKIFTDDEPDFIQTESLFDFPSKTIIKNHILKLVTRLFPSEIEVIQINNENSENSFDDEDSLSDSEPPTKKYKSYAELLKSLHEKASAPKSPRNLPEPRTLATAISQEMTLLEKCGTRGHYLELVYKALLTIKPTSVESERSFSASGYLCSKVRTSFNDDTLSALCFLRQLFKNPIAFPVCN